MAGAELFWPTARLSRQSDSPRQAAGGEGIESPDTTKKNQCAALRKLNKLNNRKKDFMSVKSTGYVWLYMQK